MAQDRRNLSNFLATDNVPETIFGIPVVQSEDQYTQEDLSFFTEHPRAAGYYSMGGEQGSDEADDLGGSSADYVEYVKDTGYAVHPYAYDSALTDAQESEYQKWRATLPRPLQYEGDYDLRGYWLDPNTVKTAVSGDHFIDKYKKPNHPTFSVESRYAVGRDAVLAGSWDDEGRYIPSDYVVSARQNHIDRMRKAIAEAVGFITEHEGFSGKAYYDAIGRKWTVGYGQTTITDPVTGRSRPVRPGDSVTADESRKYVRDRVLSDALRLRRSHPWTSAASSGAMSALYDIAYNAGIGALGPRKSPKLNRDGPSAEPQDVDSVVWREVPTYIGSRGKPVKGLAERRADAVRRWKKKEGN